MKIIVTGSSGLVGSALVVALRHDGHEMVRLVRRPPRAADERQWDPSTRSLDPALLSDVDGVVNLAGPSIGNRRWTRDYQKTLVSARVNATYAVSTALAEADSRPRVLLSASAVGWYGDRGDEVLDESAPAGTGFLAELCRAWEAATTPASEAGVRVARLRSGLIFAPQAPLARRLLPPFRLGLGGRLGSGHQYWPMISLHDHVAAIRFLLTHPTRGPVNLSCPEPVTNREFMATLGRILRRPTVTVVPAAAVRVGLGKFADEGPLASQRVVPAALSDVGFRFEHPTAESVLRWTVSGR